MTYGSKVWIFPDAELPPEGVNSIPGHESIIITNVSDEDAYIKITLLYTDKEPVSDLEICVKARRVRCLRTNEEKILENIQQNLENSMRLCWKVIPL